MTNVIKSCLNAKFTEATSQIDIVFNEGFNLIDIINTLTKVIQNMGDFKSEELRLNYLKEASMIKMKTLEGNNS